VSAAAQRATIPARAVDVRAIERELAGLLAPDGSADEAVVRACMSNLLVYCETGEQARSVPEEIATIVHHHPSRVVLLVGDAGGDEPGLEAWVSAHCYLAGGGRQICSEHVTLRGGRDAARRLPSTARSLLIGDLPTSLWWATPEPPPRTSALFQELSGMARRVIFDSVGWSDPVHDLVATAEWVGGTDASVSDLAWRRLKPWRRALSQTLDPAVLPDALHGIEEVAVEHGPAGLSQAWWLLGWLVSALGWDLADGAKGRGSELLFGFRSRRGPVGAIVRGLEHGEPDLRSVTLRWGSGRGPGEASFSAAPPGRIAIRVAGSAAERVVAAPTGGRADLVARELPKLHGDSLLREVLRVSHAMAAAVPR
jgi:glucose-6-phosphate dehydrogenase assembly protein OpcA